MLFHFQTCYLIIVSSVSYYVGALFRKERFVIGVIAHHADSVFTKSVLRFFFRDARHVTEGKYTFRN